MGYRRALVSGGLILFLGLLRSTAATPQNGDTNEVWTVGTFDRSSAEFTRAVPEHPVSFVPGQNQSSKDWFATQPVEFISAAGSLNPGIPSAPRTIQFQLAGAPAAAYRLHISVLIESACVPELRVGINGKSGNFYLHPKLDRNMGDGIAAFSANYSHADVEFDFSGGFLHQGDNSLTLQAVEYTNEVIPDALIAYDAIELDRNPTPTAQLPEITPTIFFKQDNGGLEEAVEVIVRSEGETSRGSIDLTIAGKQYHQPLADGQDFGDQRLEFKVPAFPAHTHAQLTWTINGKRHHEEQVIEPAKKWTLFLVPHIHLDVGFTDYQAKVAAAQSRSIDEALDLIAKHPEFRFSLDGEWPLAQFMETSTPAQRQRALEAIRKQELFVPAQYVNLVTGFPTAETLIRSLYPSADLSREQGTPFDYANITDVPSYSWSYASILAASGIKDFLAASDNYRAPLLMQGHLNENSPFWWEGPDGGKVLFWDSRSYGQIKVVFGKQSQLTAGHDVLPVFLQQYDPPDYRADATILFGTQGENSDLYPQQADLAARWNRIYAYPRLQYAGVPDAMEAITRQLGDNIPTISGDGGPYWEDGVASDSFSAALERENESRAPSAEKLAVLSTLVNPRLAVNKPDLDRMWRNILLMDEHTFTGRRSIVDPTSAEPVDQLAVKNQYAVNAHVLVDSVARNSMARITDSIAGDVGSLTVFNTLNWNRSGLVAIDLDDGLEIIEPSTGRALPIEVLRSGNRFRRILFMADDIPAMGYKRYEFRRELASELAPTTTQGTTIESAYYRLVLDPETGAVRSIYDKQLMRELVNLESPYRFGQYLYVSGGDQAPNSLLQYRVASPQPTLKIDPSREGRLLSVTRTPWGWVARMQSTDTNTPTITSEIRLFEHEKKIEFTEDICKKEVYTKEAVYFAFPFAMVHPQFQYEIQTGVVDPAKDMYPGAGHEWFSAQHWVSVQQDGVAATVMPLDASLITLGDINRGAWPSTFGDRPGTIFSYVMNNYWDTNYRASQGGSFRFRYVVTSAPSVNAPELSRIGWDEMTPLETDEVILQDRSMARARPLANNQASFLDVQGGNVLLETWKPAEDRNGTILRFLDLGGGTRTITVKTPLQHLQAAWLTDAVERNQQPLPLEGSQDFSFTLHRHQVATVRIVGEDIVKPPAL